MSTHPVPASKTDEVPDIPLQLDPIYTNLLIQNDESFATECSETHAFGSRALGGAFNMAQSVVAVSEQGFTTRNNEDQYLDVDTYSWEECLQVIEGYEWTVWDSKPLSVHGAASFEIAPVSYDEHRHEVPAVPDMVYAAEVPLPPTDASGRCDPEDTSRDHPASPAASPDHVTIETATAFITGPAPAKGNTPESTTATRELEDTLAERTMVIEYPPTPAMSVSELHNVSEEILNKPLPTTEFEPAEAFRGDTEPRIATTSISVRATTHYCPPTVTDQPESGDNEHHVLSPSVPTVLSLCAADSQIILRPPQDFYRTYIAEEVANGSPLPQHDAQASERAQTAVAFIPRTLNTKPASNSSGVWPDTPPASPGTKSQENDMSFVMSALASYSAQLPTHDLKRPLISTKGDVNTHEEHVAKRQKQSRHEPRMEAGKEFHSYSNSLRDERTVVALPKINAKPDFFINSEAQAISPMQEHTFHKVATDLSNTPAVLAGDELRPSPHGDHGGRTNSGAVGEQLAGACFEPPGLEMEERVTTASRSPTLVTSSLPSALSGYTGITFKPLEPPVDTAAPIKSEVNDQEEHNDSILAEHISDAEDEELQTWADTQESDELSEADEEEINILATEMEIAPEDVPKTTLPIRQSTPAPLTEAVDERASKDSTKALTTDHVITDQDANAAQAVKLRHEAEFHYERRATRSETRTSDRDHARMPSIEDATDPPHASTIKQEDPEPSQLESKPRSRQTRSTTTKPSAPKPKSPATRAKPTPKTLSARTSASRSGAKPATKAKRPTRTIATTATPKPKTAASIPPETCTATKSRTTRRISAREEELRRAMEADNNIAKRLRSQDGE